jgi:hypothetical protein
LLRVLGLCRGLVRGGEERVGQGRVEVVDVQLTGLFADLFGRKREQQPERVTV